MCRRWHRRRRLAQPRRLQHLLQRTLAIAAAPRALRNIDFLQNAIQHGVYRRSNKQYVVGRQDSDVLKIIMRSIFLQYSKNKSDDIKGQVETLNKLVLDYAVPQVYGSAQGYMKYKHDASTLVVPLSNPIMSKTNDKQLLLKPWF